MSPRKLIQLYVESNGVKFIREPVEVLVDGADGVARPKCIYPPLRRVFVNDVKGNAIFAQEDIPKDLYIPYGGREKILTKEEHDRIYKNNIAKYGGESRTFYWVDYPADPANYKDGDPVVIVDAHPRHARAADIPIDNCWPGSQINTVPDETAEDDPRINCDLVWLPPGKYNRKTRKGYDVPEYPHIHHRIFARTLRPIKKGEELLTRYGWTKNRMTRVFGPLISKPSGHRKVKRIAPPGEVLRAENSELVIALYFIIFTFFLVDMFI